MNSQTIADIIARMQSKGKNQAPFSYDSFRILLDRLGNPQLKLPPTVHVAGTNGKGSTLAYLNSIMQKDGLRVHRYTSPHLLSVCERIQTSNRMITEVELEKHLLTIEPKTQGLNLTFFDLMTAAAFLEFSSTPADYLLLETGIGGKLDPTNVIERLAACIITQISHDHMDCLGPNLADIARAKAGIIKDCYPVITYSQESVIMHEIEDEARAKQAPLLLAEIKDYKTALLGSYQNINASLAARAAHLLGMPEELILEGIATAQWPCRMQSVAYGGRKIWLDMAHNASAAIVARSSMEQLAQTPFHLIFTLRESKDLLGFLTGFKTQLLSLTYVPIKLDYATGHTISSVHNICEELDLPFSTAENLKEAVRDTPEGPVLVAGSALLLAEAFVDKN